MLMLTSCGSEPVQEQAPREIRQQPQVRVTTPPVETVKSYGLADNQAFQHLLNAETQIQAGDNQAALKELDLINFADLSAEQRSKFNLLDAQVALSMGDAEHALLMLETARPKLLSETDQINYYQSLAFAHSLMGNILPGVSARIRLGGLLRNPQRQQENISTILNMLSVLPLDTLNAPPAMVDELSGWIALAKILKQREPAGFDVAGQIQQWRQAYPGHPANAEFLQAYLAGRQRTAGAEQALTPAQPGSATAAIAVLLPASGSFAQAGKAIKDGIMAAHRLAASATPQPALKFYDSEQGDIVGIYKQALTDGATQVIGPLVKEQIQSLTQNAELSVPVLALNHVENLSKPNLYQFGLSPIDEAEQLTLKARREGRLSAVLLVPNTSQGQRIGHYLSEAWQINGGIVSGMQSYDPKQHDIAAVLNALLTSTAAPGGQQQAQTVLLSANPELGRELAPQLKYHQNGDLAVYAMPNIYSGHQSPAQDAELGKINFCDIPWLFADVYRGPLSQAALQDIWQNLGDNQIRLMALGIDAYNLLGRLSQLAGTPYAGATGRLSLNGENRITRKLVCAQFKGGVPVASGFIE